MRKKLKTIIALVAVLVNVGFVSAINYTNSSAYHQITCKDYTSTDIYTGYSVVQAKTAVEEGLYYTQSFYMQ